MPEFLNEEMEDLINSMYKPDGKERIFPLSKRYFQHEMEREVKCQEYRKSDCMI